MSSHRSQKNEVIAHLARELAPYPGRLAASLRDTLAVCLVVILTMVLHVPGVSLSLALLFLMQRERPGMTLRIGLEVFSGAAAACVVALVWVQITDGTEIARFLGLVVGIFISAFCMAATTQPLFFTIFGFYGFVFLSAWDNHHTTSSIVTYILYNVASIGLVVLCANAVEFLFGTHRPEEELAIEMQRRLQLLSKFFRALTHGTPSTGESELRAIQHSMVQYANAGDIYLNELYDRLRNAYDGMENVPIGIHYRIGLVTRAIQKSLLIGFNVLQQKQRDDDISYLTLAELCDRLQSNPISVEPLPPIPSTASARLQDIYRELVQYAQSGDTKNIAAQSPLMDTSSPARSFRIFLPGVFQSADTVFYALKLTFAAIICYLLYNAFAWPGILTCVVTVLFTGLSSTGAMKQKQLYRFSGATIGGLLGIATVSLLYPNMDSITSLLLVVIAVSMLSGWVLRSPRMSYVGVQIAFGFFLTALPGFRPATQLNPARDRIVGVGLGILVMWFIFDQLWPVRTTEALHSILLRVRQASLQLHEAASEEKKQRSAHLLHLRTAVSLELASVQQLDSAVYFDVGRHQRRELAGTRRLIRQIEAAAADFYSNALRINQETKPQSNP